MNTYGFLRVAACCPELRVADCAFNAVRTTDQADGNIHPNHLPVLAHVSLLRFVERDFSPQELADPLAVRLAILRVIQIQRPHPPQQLFAGVAGDRAVAVVDP